MLFGDDYEIAGKTIQKWEDGVRSIGRCCEREKNGWLEPITFDCWLETLSRVVPGQGK